MGCLLGALAGLLALAVPASIAPASLVGALVCVAVLTALALGAVRLRPKKVEELTATSTKRSAEARIVVVGVLYAAIVVIIHVATA